MSREADDEHGPDDRRPADSRARRAIGALPPWKRKLLGLSLVVALIGAGVQAASAITRKNAAPPVTVAPEPGPAARDGKDTGPPPGASGFVGRDQSPSGSGPGSSAAPEPEADALPPSKVERLAPVMTKIGGSFFVGLIVGTIFRTFVKTAAMIAAAAAALFFALSFFKILDIDLTNVQSQYEGFAGWVSAQATKLKDAAMGAVPSTTSAAAGFFAGFKRR